MLHEGGRDDVVSEISKDSSPSAQTNCYSVLVWHVCDACTLYLVLISHTFIYRCVVAVDAIKHEFLRLNDKMDAILQVLIRIAGAENHLPSLKIQTYCPVACAAPFDMWMVSEY
ncbi:hypothetical protein Patl1_05921 [Pistacia atlantica]|uniref:Uncharacterized protein n=1 Tax=Pistacia atlantica TaxID=434234 RepID=A0ACC1BUF1_9ROSI|nr:hypothetical protein Patl1_05921 [Pistacia atlantica]